MKKRQVIALVILIAALLGVRSTAFIVDEGQQGIVLQLGKPVGSAKTPGLHFKTPFIQNVQYFDRRILEYDATARPIITKDKKTLVVDNFAKWQIIDPLKFLKTVRTEGGAQSRLDDIVYSELRVDLARKTLVEIVTKDRAEIMGVVTKRSDIKARD